MTNEQKAKELIQTWCNNKYFARDVYNAVMDMAEWKEKQMIDKVCEFIAKWFYEHPHIQMVSSDEFKNIIDELLDEFKLAMKGDGE